MVRLVKGAYWDTEVKRAQERGLADYPVFTRKAATDLYYVACAKRLLAVRPRLYPQFATHNALTVATILEMAGGQEGFEFQRLHGMGEPLYAQLLETVPGAPAASMRRSAAIASCWPIWCAGCWRTARTRPSSAPSAIRDVPVEQLLRAPAEHSSASRRPPRIRASRCRRELYGAVAPQFARAWSSATQASFDALLARDRGGAQRRGGVRSAAFARSTAQPVKGRRAAGDEPDRRQDRSVGSRSVERRRPSGDAAMHRGGHARASAHGSRRPAASAPPRWSAPPICSKQRRDRLIALLAREGGKTLDDGVAEIREAVDFCRYYAAQARTLFRRGRAFARPDRRARTCSACAAAASSSASRPWNFPLAIFLGQVAAALAAGNAVIAKPAEQTPLIAFEARAARCMRRASRRPRCNSLLGDGEVGAALVAHPACRGRRLHRVDRGRAAINRALAAKDGPIVPLIAETGGINAMIVDATALPEQVADDVVIVRLPLRRAALLGAAAALPAGRRRRRRCSR